MLVTPLPIVMLVRLVQKVEGVFPDASDAVRDRDARQAGAAVEGIIPDAGDRISFNGVRND